MLYGELAPKFTHSDYPDGFILPSEKCKIEKKVDVKYKDEQAIDGTLHRDFVLKSNSKLKKKITYKISMVNIIKDEFDIMKLFDGKLVEYYPHSDSPIHFKAYMSFNFYYRSNMYFKDGCIIEVTESGV